MNKHVKKLISFVTRKYSLSIDHSRDTDKNDTDDTVVVNRSTESSTHSEVILDPAQLSDICDKTTFRTQGFKKDNVEFTKDCSRITSNSHHQNEAIASTSSVQTSSSTPSLFKCDVKTGTGSCDIRFNGNSQDIPPHLVSSGGRLSRDNTPLDLKELQVLSFDEETPRLSDEVELTDDQKAELKQAFSMFEKTGKGRIQARDLGELLRCLGWNPSEQDLEEARHELELSTRGTISFSEVEAYIARRGGIYYGNNAEEDIMVAFQVLDKTGSGKITVSDFRHFMTTMGERMSHEEVEELIECSTRGGKDYIEYRDLVHAVQQSPT